MPRRLRVRRARPARPPRPARGCGRDVPEDRTRSRLAGLLEEDRETKRDDGPPLRTRAPAGSVTVSYEAEVLADGLVVKRRDERAQRVGHGRAALHGRGERRKREPGILRTRGCVIERDRVFAVEGDGRASDAAAAALRRAAPGYPVALEPKFARTRDPRRRRVPGKVDRAVHGVRVAGARRRRTRCLSCAPRPFW